MLLVLQGLGEDATMQRKAGGKNGGGGKLQSPVGVGFLRCACSFLACVMI